MYPTKYTLKRRRRSSRPHITALFPTTHKTLEMITTLFTIAYRAIPEVIRDFSIDDVVVGGSVSEPEIEELSSVVIGGPAL